ncbi:MBL fold metallo-hydrolase [Paracoccus sp. S-4012]|uniref:MBL fold metallo-hydrolase n=1 Tax=Paracoccus sp. S-4012 TaxID=2665648 RepID=UPI001E559797|nr:MBL fold metallo-hydrolase [Paracoccus sp. S-4012]
MMTRRATLALAAAGLAAATLPHRAAAQEASFAVPGGQMTLRPVEHASLVIELPEARIAVDPVGAADRYGATPDLILVTHEHGDHYSAETLAALMGEQTRLITNPAVFEMLPEDLKSRALAMANGESHEDELGLTIDAVPAYNTTEDRQQYHPKGRDNGYVLTLGEQRLYIAGDTEDTPEMRALTGITLALLPMNLPYTQTPEQAASAVAEFQPQIAIPYHHGGTDPAEFARLVEEQGGGTQVEILDWYPASDDPAGGDD